MFRFALEKWKPSPFDVTVYSNGVLSETDRSVVRQIDGVAHANVRVTHVDLTGTITVEQRKRWESLGASSAAPQVAIAYPDVDGRELFWTGALAGMNVAATTDSPARREIAERLLTGDAIVFVLLEGTDRTANDAAAALLEKELPRLAKVTRLPDPSAKGPQVESPLPFKIAFSYLRVSRSAPGEQMFVRMLWRCKPGVESVDGPVVLPFFGRGRLLDALYGEDWNAEMLVKVVDFLCRACTCHVKDANPGLDLLFAVDWDGRVFPEIVPTAVTQVENTTNSTDSHGAASNNHVSKRRWLWAALAAAALSTFASGVWVARSRRRGPNP